MSDEKIDHAALIAEVKHFAPWAKAVSDDPTRAWHLIQRLGNALEAAQQAPAVDREALAQTIYKATTGTWAWADDQAKSDFREVASDVIASGVLLDAAEVEARGLEKAAESGEFNSTECIALNKRAQQVREGN